MSVNHAQFDYLITHTHTSFIKNSLKLSFIRILKHAHTNINSTLSDAYSIALIYYVQTQILEHCMETNHTFALCLLLSFILHGSVLLICVYICVYVYVFISLSMIVDSNQDQFWHVHFQCICTHRAIHTIYDLGVNVVTSLPPIYCYCFKANVISILTDLSKIQWMRSFTHSSSSSYLCNVIKKTRQMHSSISQPISYRWV